MNTKNSNPSGECPQQLDARKETPKPVNRMKLGLDVHADSIVVVRILDNEAPQPAQKFSPNRFITWARKQLAQADEVHSCYEAGPFGFVLHRQLTEMGINNSVVQPVCLDERIKGVNNDKTDAKELALRLDRYVSGNTHAMALVRVPTLEEEATRAESRQREQLKRQVQRVAAQGRSLLLSMGYREKGAWWSEKRWAFLQSKIPDWLIERLEVFRRLLSTMIQELDTATRHLEAAANSERPKGLGGMTSEIVDREVGDWNRFENRRQIASYTGLCGGVSASGKTKHLLPITKHGNGRLRTALIELAWRLVRWQRDCILVQKWSHILINPKASKGARKKAIVAVARQMAVDLWRWRTGKMSPKDFGWTMVGIAA